MDRHPVAISAATGSTLSTFFWLLRDLLSQRPHDIPLDFISGPPSCPAADIDSPDIPLNFWTGLICGLIIWPLLEFLVLLKQWAILALRAKVACAGGEGRLYKVLA